MGMLLHRHLADNKTKQADKPAKDKNESVSVRKAGRPKKQ